jgi:hypothetical protein
LSGILREVGDLIAPRINKTHHALVDYDLSLGLDPRLLKEVGDLIAPRINKTHHALVDYDLSLGLDPNTVQLRIIVGWVERSVTQQICWVPLRYTQPTQLIFELN